MHSDGSESSEARWGAQTELAVANFAISGDRVPGALVQALAAIKAEAALVNLRHGIISAPVAAAIAEVADEIAAGGWSDQFPVDVLQTGSGTSTNMNVNEVIAAIASSRCGEVVHPNDHVNACQSSNDTFPSASRIAAASMIVRSTVPALEGLRGTLSALSERHVDTLKMARTHLMDALPMTFGQEVGGWSRMVDLAVHRLNDTLVRLCELPLGGTAVGTGMNAPENFGGEMAAGLANRTGLPLTEAIDHFEAQSSNDALVEVSATCRTVALSMNKICGDLRLLGSGPTGGFGEIELPALQAGSSIMPGKVNPVIPEAVQQAMARIVGNDATVVFASTLASLQLGIGVPVVAHAVLSSLSLLANSATVLVTRCLEGLMVNSARMADLAGRSPALATTLVPAIGYDLATEVVKHALATETSIAQSAVHAGVDPDVLGRLGELRRMTRPGR